jgi:hypothetical protein
VSPEEHSKAGEKPKPGSTEDNVKTGVWYLDLAATTRFGFEYPRREK